MKRFLQPGLLAFFYFLSPGQSWSGSDDNVTAGQHVYVRCSGCHAPAYHRAGPKHCGIAGRRAGSVAGFTYSRAMKDSGIIWTRATIDQFLQAPLKMIPGTSMGFSGIASDKERAQLVAFLMQLNAKNPLCR